MEKRSIGYALLATQVALLDVVTPQLRAVVVDFCKEDGLFYIRFYYDGEVNEDIIEWWSCAVTEASANFGYERFVDGEVERLDYPKEIPVRGRYAYLRKEPYSPTEKMQETTVDLEASYPKEMIDFKEPIGYDVDCATGEKIPTMWGIIHHAKEGVHIVPARPKDVENDVLPVAYALLAMQRALLDVVTPELRAVAVDASKEEYLLYMRFFYDGEVSKEVLELWNCALTETIASLGPDYIVDEAIIRLDFPEKIPFHRGRYAYFRKES